MSTILNLESFIPDEVQEEKLGITGTIEATVNGSTRRVMCHCFDRGSSKQSFFARGFVARYKTGTKLWTARVCVSPNYAGEMIESVMSGFDSRQGIKVTPQLWFYDAAKHDSLMSKR